MYECSIGTCNTAGTIGAGGMSPFFWRFFWGDEVEGELEEGDEGRGKGGR